MGFKNDQVSENETRALLKLAEESLKVRGDFVELGCYKGDTALALAELLRKDGDRKRLWIYDSFEGLPAKREEDESAIGKDFQKGELAVSKREVKERFLRAGLKVPVIKKAWFSDLELSDLPEKISFAFLDGDFYESIKDSLRLVEKLMADGGKIVVHDYCNPALPGVAAAVDEWARGREIKKRQIETMIVMN